MNAMYTAFACFVLFDARGTGDWLHDTSNVHTYTIMAILLSSSLLALAYIPRVVYRPQLVDALCADVLAIAAHGVGVWIIGGHDRALMHGCALQCACYILEKRFLAKQPIVPPALTHTVAFMLLAASYVYGPRITDIRKFVLASTYPHLLELAACFLGHMHKVVVAIMMDAQKDD